MSEPTPLEKIFFAALEKASGLRAAYLDEVCAGDGKLRHRVELMLSAQAYSASFLESPASVPGLAQIATAVPTNTEVIGSQIGPYKLIEQIGDGGMGVVYMAAQKEPVRRMVALKVIKAGMDTQQVVARFEAERQALAMMDHPNIAKILDAGATDAGRPYFVMELVKGAPFTEFCDRHKLDTKHRLQLFITVCQAVQHAHQKGLIHRDIKPSNIIVGMHDVTPVPKVIDFGVAKAIGQQLTEKTLHSGFHQMVGTPLYMSPEQAGQSSIDIDTRSDIYSLGVLLYEILTGHTPFESETLRNAGYDEMRRMIREVDPPRPSLRVSTLDAKALSTISDNRNVDARKLSHQLRGELDWIVMMALEKDRNRRYDTANEFADDVQRFLNDEAVQACPPSTLYRFRKLASRNRATLSAATLVAAALIIGTAVATWQAMRARDSQAQTEIAKQQIDLRYRIAKEAVDTYLLRVTQDERLDHPSFRQLRQSLLEAALPYYDQLHEISPTDEQSRSARAETLNQLGTVKHELGRFDESLTSFEESAKLFDLLSADNAAKIDYRQSLAKVLVNLADHYRTRGATSESLEYEQHALALRQQLVTEHPDNDLLHLELAQSYTNVGVGTQEMDGREMLERAIEIWQELADRFPDQPLYREYLSLGYQNLANRFAWDQAEQAIPFHELAIGLLEQLAKEQPESKKAHIQWAQSHQSLADTLEKLSPRLSDAREHCEESIRILSAFAKRHPESPEVKSHLANSLTKLAHTLKELDELVMAHETCDSSLRLWEQLQLEYSDMLEYEVGMAAAQQNLGAIVVAQGQAAEGISMLTQSRDRLQKLVDRIGPHDRSNDLLRTITSSLADTRKVLNQGRERSSDDEIPERKIKTAGEALRPSKFLTDLSNSPTHGLRVGGMASSLTQTEAQEQSMKRLLTKHSRSAIRPQIRNERPLRMEQLEARALLAAVAAPSGLVSWWSANGNGADVMGLNNATLYNGATYAAGEVGQAFKFDGVNDRAQIADSPSLRLTGSLSIEGWIKISAFPTTGNSYIFLRGDDTRTPYSLFVQSSGLLNFSLSPATGNGSGVQAYVSTGQLIHVAATLDDTTGLMSLYVNGSLAGQSTTDVRPYGDLLPASNPGVGIGNTGGFPGTATNSPFSGLIDDLAIYNRALSQSEVLGIFKAGSDGKVLSPISVNGSSVIEGALETNVPASFTIQRTGSLSGSLTVAYATADDTANSGTDYAATSGTLTFADGEATKTIQIIVNGDNTSESNETFRLIVNPAGGIAVMGVATILNDDSTLSISSASATEGDAAIRYFDDFIPVQSQLGGGRHGAYGPDGNLYIAGRFTNDVQKFDGKTGAYLGEVVPNGSFGLHAAWALVFGPDGNLYVGGQLSKNVLRYNMTTGVIDEFVSASTGLPNANGLAFDSSGNLCISTGNDSSVWRFQGPNGATPGAPLPAPGQSNAIFVPQGSGGLSSAQGAISFGPDGNLYVGNWGNSSVLRYNGITGTYIDAFVPAGSGGLSGPNDLTFHPDGFLYVSSQNNGAVYRYNSTTGAFQSQVAQNADPHGSPYGAGALASDSNGNLLIGFNAPGNMQSRYGRYGTASQEAFTITLDYASAIPVTVSYSTADGSAIAVSDYKPVTSGTVYFAPGETSKTILIQTLDDTTTELTETFTVNLSNPVGATIAVGQGIGSIIDNDPFTKFYVVNDASTDRTYEYGETGASVENYALAGGNTAPRGAVSTAAGAKVWVVDANKSVYAYDTSGALQGSWAAGGLQSTAQLEGIATNGTDVWLVDNKTDKVYRYANAASLTNGSPVATSSFSLNSSNTSPKDIVTDGSYLWVVNDSSTDKVFKYTIGGTYVGSWTISTSGASSPTGITLDPSNPSAIWIVDSRTAKVYQYDNAVGLTSGSKSANSSWALAAGNTNPQGIADPPPPAVLGAPGKTSDMKSPFAGAVPMPWFSGSTANDGSVSLQQVQSRVRTTDEFMSVLGLVSEQPKATVSVGRMTTVEPDKSIQLSKHVGAELQDDNMEDLIGLVAHDLWR